MRDELRRNNTIGNSDGIEKFLYLVFEDKISGVEALNHSFRYHSLSQFNCFLALLLFEELKLIEVSGDSITFTEAGIEVSNLPMAQRKTSISEKVLNLLLVDNLINCEQIKVDSVTGELKIPINAFSLAAAVYRNFLHSLGSFLKEGFYFVFTNEKLREEIEKKIIQKKKKVSQEELLLRLQKQQEDGEKGEVFVVEYEKRRLEEQHLLPKRISVIDACAGYDVLSCHDSTSDHYNRYIEVKAFRGNPHFYWSSNEKSIAEALGNDYYLYLVDLNKLEKEPALYVPQTICNPAEKLSNDEWLIEPDSYRITYLK